MDNIKIDPDNEYTFSFYMNDKWHECSLPNDNYELVGKDFVILNGVFFYTGNIVPVVVDGNKIKIGDSFIRSADDDGGGLHTPIVWLRNATIADLVGEERNCPHAYAKNKVNDYTYQIASCSFLIYPNNSLIEVYNSKNEYKVGEDVTCSVVLHGPKTAVANVFLNGEWYTRLEGTRAHELTITGLHEGTYAVDVFLDGDDYVTPYNTLALFTVEKTDPVLTLTGTTPADTVFTDGGEVQYHPENPVIINAANDKAVSDTSWKWTISDPDVVTQDHIVNNSGDNAINSEDIYLNTVSLGQVTLSARFSGNYMYYPKKATMTFTVVPMTVSNPIIEVVGEDELYYDGTAKEPVVNVYYAEDKLIPADEYEVTYSNNTDASKENCKAKVIVKSKTGARYSFTGEKEFVIQESVPVIEMLPTASAITYGQTLAVSTISGGVAKVGELTASGSYAWKDATIAPAVSDSNTTEYEVTFTPESPNYLPTTCKVKLTVNKAAIPTDSITPPTAITDLTYTGSPQALVTSGSVAMTDSTAVQAPDFDGTSASANKRWSTAVPTALDADT